MSILGRARLVSNGVFAFNVRHQCVQNARGNGGNAGRKGTPVLEVRVAGEISAGQESGGDRGQMLKGFLWGELDLIF